MKTQKSKLGGFARLSLALHPMEVRKKYLGKMKLQTPLTPVDERRPNFLRKDATDRVAGNPLTIYVYKPVDSKSKNLISKDDLSQGMTKVFKNKGNFRFHSIFSKNKRYFVEIPSATYIKERLDSHFEEVILPKEKSAHEREKMFSTILDTLLLKGYDSYISPWDFTIVRNHPNPKWANLVLFRFHHSLGDGFSIGRAMMDMYDDEEVQEYEKILKKKFKRISSLFAKAYLYIWIALNFIPVLLFFIVNFFQKDYNLIEKKKIKGKIKCKHIKVPLQLSTVKKIGKQYGKLTVNETIMALVSHAFSKTLKIDKKTYVRVSVAVNVRLKYKSKPSNEVGGAVLKVPLGNYTWKNRCKQVKKNSNFMKKYPAHWYTYFLFALCSLFSVRLLKFVSDFFAEKYESAQTTNVPYIPFKVHLGKKKFELVELTPICPLSAKSIFSVGILSYNGKICVGFVHDRGFEDFQKIIDEFEKQYYSLLNELKKKE